MSTPTVYDFEARQINGKDIALSKFKGKVMLIVNTASQCGFSPQFGGLEVLHKTYGGQGLAVLGFPCNQFGEQDPGNDGDIAEFCQVNDGVSFPMMGKIDVNGPGRAPALQVAAIRSPGPAGQQGHQMELHQVFDWQGRSGDQALCADGQASGFGERH